MTILSQREQQQIAADVRLVIESSGETARVLRPNRQGADTFFGAHEAAEVEVAVIPCELRHLPPEEVQQKGHDAELHVLPGAPVLEGDFAVMVGVRYRVTDVKPHNCFGVVTHLELKLELEQRNRG